MVKRLFPAKFFKAANHRADTISLSQEERADFKHLKISPSFLVLLGFICLLALAHIVVYLFVRTSDDPVSAPYILHRLVAVDGESNLPTWYNSFLWLILGLLALFISVLPEPDPKRAKKLKQGGRLLAFVAIAASIDEIAQVHETFSHLTNILLKDVPVLLNIKWTIPGLLVAFVIGIFLLSFVWQFPKKISRSIFIGGAIFLSGAVGVEILTIFWSDRFGLDGYYNLFTVIEESMEMAGLAFALSAFLSAIEYNVKEGTFRLVPKN